MKAGDIVVYKNITEWNPLEHRKIKFHGTFKEANDLLIPGYFGNDSDVLIVIYADTEGWDYADSVRIVSKLEKAMK